MTTRLVLVDSNSYLRLARHIPSLLGVHADYELRVLPGFDEEFLKSSRLQSKFTWPAEPPHPAERKRWSLSVDAASAKAIRDSTKTVRDFAEAFLAGKFDHKRKHKGGDPLPILSNADLRLLTHAYHFKCVLLTDERPLRAVAREFEVEVKSSLQILRYLVGLKVIKEAQVESIVKYWQFDRDTPYRGWEAEYKKLFKKAPPAAV